MKTKILNYQELLNFAREKELTLFLIKITKEIDEIPAGTTLWTRFVKNCDTFYFGDYYTKCKNSKMGFNFNRYKSIPSDYEGSIILSIEEGIANCLFKKVELGWKFMKNLKKEEDILKYKNNPNYKIVEAKIL